MNLLTTIALAENRWFHGVPPGIHRYQSGSPGEHSSAGSVESALTQTYKKPIGKSFAQVHVQYCKHGKHISYLNICPVLGTRLYRCSIWLRHVLKYHICSFLIYSFPHPSRHRSNTFSPSAARMVEYIMPVMSSLDTSGQALNPESPSIDGTVWNNGNNMEH